MEVSDQDLEVLLKASEALGTIKTCQRVGLRSRALEDFRDALPVVLRYDHLDFVSKMIDNYKQGVADYSYSFDSGLPERYR
tara:strand:- start:18 stop:260 length:243 start_codon:yes stop_codon:yes gene_type:complete